MKTVAKRKMFVHAFKLLHCMSLCRNRTINNMSCCRREKTRGRIKTFICMIMLAGLLSTVMNDNSSLGLRVRDKPGGWRRTCCFPQKILKCSFHYSRRRYMEKFVLILCAESWRMNFIFECAHICHSIKRRWRWLFMVRRVSTLSRNGPWASSTITFKIPLIDDKGKRSEGTRRASSSHNLQGTDFVDCKPNRRQQLATVHSTLRFMLPRPKLNISFYGHWWQKEIWDRNGSDELSHSMASFVSSHVTLEFEWSREAAEIILTRRLFVERRIRKHISEAKLKEIIRRRIIRQI